MFFFIIDRVILPLCLFFCLKWDNQAQNTCKMKYCFVSELPHDALSRFRWYVLQQPISCFFGNELLKFLGKKPFHKKSSLIWKITQCNAVSSRLCYFGSDTTSLLWNKPLLSFVFFCHCCLLKSRWSKALAGFGSMQ